VRVVLARGGSLGERVAPIVHDLHDAVVEVESLDALSAAVKEGPVDWLVSAGFRHIIPMRLLDAARDTCNVHPSMLPWGRGANPNVWMIALGEPAGVSIHRMVPEVDAGPIFAQASVPTTFGDTADLLYNRLLDRASELFASAWPAIRAGQLPAVEQPPGGSIHRVAELLALRDIDLDATVTWRAALDCLRALTFPPHPNLVVDSGGRRFHVELKITDVTDDASR
jgi:methionyl-tRNA formyltransferase